MRIVFDVDAFSRLTRAPLRAGLLATGATLAVAESGARWAREVVADVARQVENDDPDVDSATSVANTINRIPVIINKLIALSAEGGALDQVLELTEPGGMLDKVAQLNAEGGVLDQVTRISTMLVAMEPALAAAAATASDTAQAFKPVTDILGSFRGRNRYEGKRTIDSPGARVIEPT